MTGTAPGLRIAVVAACPFPVPRGTPLRVARTAEALTERGHDVHVMTYHVGDAQDQAPYAVHRIAPIESYQYRGPGPTWRKLLQLDPLLARGLARLLRQRPFDVIHAHHYEGLLVALAARPRRLPVVYDAHTMLETELAEYGPRALRGAARALGRLIDRRLPRRADAIAAASPGIAGSLARHHPHPARVRFVPAGIESSWFATAPAGVSADTLVYAGNLAVWQGIADLLECLRLARASRPGLRLTIVTDDDFEPWEALARRLEVRDAIGLARPQPGSVAPLLAGAAVLVHPRRPHPGLPQKLLNYMASGRPIVAYAASAQLLEHGRTGWLVPDGDVAALSAGLLRCLDDPCLAAKLGAAAREAARQFTWARAAGELEALFHDVVRGARGS